MNSQTYDVSVVVPTHGRPDLLAKLLDSLVEQDFPGGTYEILVIHNISEDDTADIVSDIAERSAVDVRYFATNFRGPHPSRRLGAFEARGRVVAFIDDDCVATRDWLAKGVAQFSDGVGIVQGRTIPNPHQQSHMLQHTIQVNDATPYFETCNIFYLREPLLEPWAFRDNFLYCGEDTDLAWNVMEHGYQARFSEEALVYHEKFHVTFWQWLRHPMLMREVPRLAKMHPGLREHLFLGYFLDKRTALFDLLLLGIALGMLLHPALAALSIPYVVFRVREPIHVSNPLGRLARVAFGTPRAFVTLLSLLYGSIRGRAIVL